MKVTDYNSKLLTNKDYIKGFISFKSRFSKLQFDKYIRQVVDDFVPAMDIIDAITVDINTFYDNNLKEDLLNTLKPYRKRLWMAERANNSELLKTLFLELYGALKNEMDIWAELSGLT